MAGLERLAHDNSVARTIKCVICAAVSQLNKMGDDIAVYLFGIDEMRHAKAFAPFFLVVIDIHTNDFIRADHARGLQHV